MTRSCRRIAFVALSFLASATLSQAKHYGQYGDVQPTIKAWIESLTDDFRISCCAMADGTIPDAWEMQKDHYRVKIYDRWYEVPDTAIVKSPNRLGHAIVWIHVTDDFLRIRCFLPGPEAWMRTPNFVGRSSIVSKSVSGRDILLLRSNSAAFGAKLTPPDRSSPPL